MKEKYGVKEIGVFGSYVREVGDYIEDIIDAMGNAIDFVKDTSYEEFTQDNRTIYATTRALEIIGEAVKNIPNDVRERYPAIPCNYLLQNTVVLEVFSTENF